MKTYLVTVKPYRGMPTSRAAKASHPATAARRALEMMKKEGEVFRDSIGFKLIITVERLQ